ncbi:hypothetical protein GCM10020331_038930 [Ectobacillus funiculus]
MVKEYQSLPVVVDKKNVSVYDAICTMFLEDVGTLFVIDHDALLIGVFIEEGLTSCESGQTRINCCTC